MPSGGSSGEVILPSYNIAQHSKWLNNNLPTGNMLGLTGSALADYDTPSSPGDPNYKEDIDALTSFNTHEEMLDAADLNPFTGVAAYDPDSDLSDLEDVLDDFSSVVADMDPSDYLTMAVAAAIEAVDTDVYSEDDIAAAVAAHEARTEEGYQRRVSSALSSLMAGRATMTTAFDGALSLMANQREAEIQDYSAKLGLLSQEQRFTLAAQFSQQFIGLVQLQLTSHQALTEVSKAVVQMRIVGMQDQIAADVGYDESEARWRPGMFEYGAQMLSAYNGAGPIPRPPTKGERFMGLLTTSATVAIQGGMALGSPQAGIAAGIGTLGAGLLSSNWR